MEFGIFNAACLLPKYRAKHGDAAEHDRIMDEVAFIVAADKAGFKYTWASEHHFLTDYSHLSASESFLAFVAAKTSNIHIGSGIFNITPPVNHPARIAERVAMLDHLSEGRFEFGTGRGSSTTEQRGFGINDPDLTREMVAEVLPQLVRMWKDEDYSYDGKFFSMPSRNVLPKPYSKPHPAIWMAAGSPSTFDLAAELGVGVLCFGFSTPDQLTPLVARYKEKIGDCKNPVGGFVNDNVMITTTMICMEDGAKARKTFLEADSNYHLSLVFRYLDTFPKPPGVPEWPEIVPAMDAASLDSVIASGDVAVGTPEEVNKAMERYVATGADQLSFGMLSSSMSIESCEEAVETFGKHLLPTFDKDPIHRTTAQRLAAGGS
jgi:alkanesulfonate monooxygenase SsuD/methylene tetrahydromethanopterin reductase-like flavin-dependent oxidoreductase (luciferase family)